jgi:hypothetical protein
MQILIVVGPSGAPASIEVRNLSGSPNILVAMVEESMKMSRFSRACAGQTVEIIFNYKLEGAPQLRAAKQD